MSKKIRTRLVQFDTGLDSVPVRVLSEPTEPCTRVNVYTPNIWNESYELGGYNNSGTKDTLTDRIRNMSPIYIDDSKSLFLVKPSGGRVYILCYKEDGTLLSRVQYNNGGVINVPAHTSYINLFLYNMGTTYQNNVAVVYGEVGSYYGKHERPEVTPVTLAIANEPAENIYIEEY